MAHVNQVRQNFHQETEAAINKQINLELHASYVYLSMAAYFDRDDVALPGFHKFFKKSSDEEREHAMKFMKYQHTRGGVVLLKDVTKPTKDDWGTGLDAMQAALALERNVNESLLELHALASSHADPQVKTGLCHGDPLIMSIPQFTDFLESEFLEEQVKSLKEIGEYVTNLKRVGPGLGEYMFDKETLSE